MYTFLIVLIVLISLALILVVLAQRPKGTGLSDVFGGGASQIMGVKRTGDFLERVTWIAAGLIMVLSVTANVMIVPGANQGINSPNIQEVQRNVPNFLQDQGLDSLSTEGEADTTLAPIEDIQLDNTPDNTTETP